jgi:exopolysaccharide biosynthesis polyprenyl glycosylphosphotransferase
VIGRHVTALRIASMLLDLLVAAALFTVLAMWRFGAGAPAGTGLSAPAWPGGAALGWGLAWVLVLWARGVYGVPLGWSWRREAVAVGTAAIAAGLVVLSALWLLDAADISRAFLLVLFAVQVLVTLGSRWLLHAGHVRLRRHGWSGRQLLVVGAGPVADAFLARVAERPALGLQPMGRLQAPADPAPGPQHGVRPGSRVAPSTRAPVIGSLDDLEALLHSRVVDDVAICLEPADAIHLAPIVARCREEGRACHVPIAPGTVPPVLEGGVLETLDGLAVLSVVPGPERAALRVAKRGMDIGGALLLLLAALPVLLGLALAIRVVDGGPVLFRQRRIGRQGREFRMLKLRTMTLDAEERLADLAPYNAVAGSAFKLERDPRLTRTGAWLRRSSLDELPQLWNVLRGEMSLVGPRPPLPEEVARYEPWQRRRLSVTPGMTGLWQVEARNDPRFDHWVRLDLRYIDDWSLRLDTAILLRTVPAVLRRDGR